MTDTDSWNALTQLSQWKQDISCDLGLQQEIEDQEASEEINTAFLKTFIQ